MPIVDIEPVCEGRGSAKLPSASRLADALGRVFGSPPGHVWVRLRILDASCYAENESALPASELPVFVTVLHAHPPAGPDLAAEAMAVTGCVATELGRPPERVHVRYAPPGAGCQAFGGRLVS